jgi:hypothetical protein
MKLASAELACVRAQGLYITEKCDGCGKLLNQTVQYTIAGRREVFCSTPCRDTAFFGDRHEAKKQATPGKCTYCGGSLKGKKRGALYCDDVCRVTHSRVRERTGTRQVEKSRTPTQSDQRVVDANNADQGNRITGALQRSGNARGGVVGSPVEVEQRISGSRSS